MPHAYIGLVRFKASSNISFHGFKKLVLGHVSNIVIVYESGFMIHESRIMTHNLSPETWESPTENKPHTEIHIE